MKVRARAGTYDAVCVDLRAIRARLTAPGFDIETGLSFDHGAIHESSCICPTLLTRHGRQTVVTGDWIVTYPDGHMEKFDAAVFTATFERVDIAALVPLVGHGERPTGARPRATVARRRRR